MKIENQCCTKVQAERLRELRVVQDKSIYRWTVYCPDPTGENYYYILMDENHPDAEHAEIIASAFTVAELGVMLPDMSSENDMYYTSCCENLYGETGRQFTTSIMTVNMQQGWKTEAEARAAMLIYLLEKQLTTIDEVNARLTT